MFNSKKLGSKIKIGFTVALGMMLMMVVAIFLLGCKEVMQVIQPRIHLIFFRLLAGIAFFSALASYTIAILDKKSFARDSWQRWTMELIVLLITVAVISLIESRFELQYPEGPSFDPNNRGMALAMVNGSIGVLMFMVYEVWTVIEDNQKLQFSLASSEKDKLALQLSSLQQKLNPHFLFNSLNVLSELMYEDPEKANEFINQFSKVYRYVLEISDQAFVKVENEINFLNSYLFLQKIRFGDKLQVNIDLDKKVLDTYTPPLAFQLLLENAIKHNIASKDSPLMVNITNDDQFLTVRNNIQARGENKISTGVGQTNLKSTYSLLSQHQPQFIKGKDEYISKLPILEKIP